jgi:RNA polymerase sigma-70 factor, ECF subfamily
MMTSSLPRFEDLLEAHHDEIYGYLWRLLDGASRADAAIEAQDLTQETFMRAYRAYPRLAANSNTRAWLYKIATNNATSHFRRNGRMAALNDEADDLPAPVGERPEAMVTFSESVGEVQAAAATLPPKQRAALAMRYGQEMNYDEIAAALGCSEDSARAHVYQALKRLRTTLGGHDEDR